MPAPLATERWGERVIKRGHSAHREWDVTDVTNSRDAINLVTAQFGVREALTHPEDNRLIVEAGGMGARQDGGVALWRVSADYVTNALTFADSPVDEPALILPDFGCSTEPIDKDVNGNPITNSARIGYPAGSIYDEFTNISFAIERWESTYDLAKALAYCYPKPKLNRDIVQIARIGTFQPGQLKCRAIRAVNGLHSDPTLDPFVRVRYEFEARSYYKTTGAITGDLGGLAGISGFCKRLFDQGRQGFFKDPVDSKRRHGKIVLYGPSGQLEECSDDFPLDGNGEPLIIGGGDATAYVVSKTSTAMPLDISTIAIVETTDNGVFLYYLTNELIAFASLGLPS